MSSIENNSFFNPDDSYEKIIQKIIDSVSVDLNQDAIDMLLAQLNLIGGEIDVNNGVDIQQKNIKPILNEEKAYMARMQLVNNQSRTTHQQYYQQQRAKLIPRKQTSSTTHSPATSLLGKRKFSEIHN